MAIQNINFSSSHKPTGDELWYLPFIHGKNGLVTIVCLQWFDYGYEEDQFIKDVNGSFIYSENEQDIIDLINAVYQPEQIDEEYRQDYTADPPVNGLQTIRFYRNSDGCPVAPVPLHSMAL